MIVAGIILGVIIMSGMAYIAASKRSAKGVRLAALIALGTMVLTVLVCLTIFFFGSMEQTDESLVFLVEPGPKPAEKSGNIIVIAVFALLLIAMFLTVLIFSRREQKKNSEKQNVSSLFIDEDL